MFDVLIIGGGAAGFYTAIQTALKNPSLKIGILERGAQVLTKVKISGGGRCNVTHAEFVPNELAKNYPRGEKELRGPFHTYCSGDTIAFFEERGVALKIEDDGRMFPVSNNSQTIIDCFLNEANALGISVHTNTPVIAIEQQMESGTENWKITAKKETFTAVKLVIATGSNPKVWNMLQGLAHRIVAPVPSLFTFNCKDNRIATIPGVSTYAAVSVHSSSKKGPHLEAEGPVLITHWGFSGPAILKLSAWGARELYDCDYQFKIKINWLPSYSTEEVMSFLMQCKEEQPKKTILKYAQFELPKRLWQQLVQACNIVSTRTWADCSKQEIHALVEVLTESHFQINGKSTFKEEFVTAGGVALKEVNFKTYESKLHPNLYFAGEVLNIDAITGGFNFQNAWTSGYIAAQAIAHKE